MYNFAQRDPAPAVHTIRKDFAPLRRNLDAETRPVSMNDVALMDGRSVNTSLSASHAAFAASTGDASTKM